jgi:xylulose-5-phosphate/fructose-6-phosphate phosphoketolase
MEKQNMKAKRINGNPLSPELLRKMDAYWRAANYLSVGQIYLFDNPLVKQPLARAHIKPRLLGHWGTTPGLNLTTIGITSANTARTCRKCGTGSGNRNEIA